MSCAICLCKIDNEHKLDCGHTFHEHCIQKWINTSPSCPICRNLIEICFDKFVKLINEINELTSYKIKFPYNKLTFKSNRKIYNKLIEIKNNMIEYNSIRSKHFSDDFLASSIGNDISKINTMFKKLIMH